jgi:hypothetical protein
MLQDIDFIALAKRVKWKTQVKVTGSGSLQGNNE